MHKRFKNMIDKSGVSKERMGMDMKMLVLFSMVTSLIFIPASVAGATDLLETESEGEMRERVFEEVLSGEITNDEDVIKVALEQYQERMNQRLRMGSPELVEDDSLSITQVLDTYADENGNVLEDVVTTGLIVVDENNNLLTGSMITTGSGQLSEYSIYATMNVNVTYDSSAGKVKFNWFDTKLTYGTAMTAGRLIQASTYQSEPYLGYDDITKQISYPQGNVAYRYVPTNMSMINYMNFDSGRTCRSEIYGGSRSFIISYSFKFETCNQNKGTWYTEYQ